MNPALEPAIQASADPEQVAARVARVLEAGAEVPADPGALVGVLGNSRFLTTHLTRHPGDAAVLADLSRPLSAEQLRAWFMEIDAPFDAALRRLKYRAFTRITARDVVLHAPVAETCREISLVAEGAIQLAFEHALAAESERHGPPLDAAGEPIPFVVIGMGKLGGNELNYSSDVDLIFFYGTDDGAAGTLSPNAFFTRVGEQMVRALSRTGDEGFVFRVDLDLRPEGRGGPMCNALASAERYYEAWGRTWERLAWLRARPVAGDLALGDRLLARLAPWIYRRTLDLDTFEAIRDMKARIVSGRRAQVARGHAAGVDVKLDPGGIRALEFLVHTLQLVHAGRDRTLRDPSTLGAMERLFAAGHLPANDRDVLGEAYQLFRRVEHRVQMDEERQTHRLPRGESLARLARRLGFSDGDALVRVVNAHRDRVAAMFDALMGGEEQADPWEEAARVLLVGKDHAVDRSKRTRRASRAPRPGGVDRDETPSTRMQLLAEYFVDAGQAAHLLDIAARHPTSPFSPRNEAHFGLGVRLLAEALRSAVPDRALTHLAELASRARHRAFDYRVLADHPQMARLLVTVFASSDYLAGGLLREPSLVSVLGGRDPWSGEGLDSRLDALGDLDTEQFLARVSAQKQRWTLEIGLADIAGELSAEQVEQALSDVAEATMRAVLARARAETASRFGHLPEAWGPAVVALGKLGGQELSYGSDLDVVFLYDADGPGDARLTPLEWFTRVAQRTISLLGLPTRAGPLYALDTRLRPDGRQGTLVTRIERFQSYHTDAAALWERLALVRARTVAGPTALDDRIQALLADLVYTRPVPDELREYARTIRARMEVEVAREEAGRYNPKTGRGGLVDIEFIVQTLQIEHGHTHPPVRTTNTLRGLRALGRAGLLEEADMLASAWRFLRGLDHRLRIVRAQSRPELRADPVTLDRLARRMGYQRDPLRDAEQAPGAQLMSDYRRWTEFVRGRLNERLGTADTPIGGGR